MPENTDAIIEGATAIAEQAEAEHERAEELVELAAIKVAEAEQTAQALADAALVTETGRRLKSLEDRINQWSSDLESTRLEVARLTAQMVETTTAIALLQPMQQQITAPPPMAPSPGPIPSVPKTEIVMAENPLSAEGAPEAPVTNKRRRAIL